MGDANHICTLRDYSKPSHKGYMNTIELPVRNNVVPLRPDPIRIVDSIDLNGDTRNTTRLRLFHFSLHDQAINWLDRLPAGSIWTWDDLTTHEPLYDAWNRFKDLLLKVPHHGLDLWLQVQIFYDHVDYTTQIAIDYAADGRLRKLRPEIAWETIEDLAQYEEEGWNDPILLEEESLDYKNPNIEQLLGVMDNMIRQLPPELSRHKAFEDLVMNFILDQEERVKKLKEYMGVIGSDFMQLSLKVVKILKDEIRAEENRVKKIKKITRKIPSIDEPEPQLVPNFSPLDVNLGDKRGTDPPIKPHSPDSFRMKVVYKSTINTPPSPHVASFHPKDMYCYYHPYLDDPKKHYEFKLGLLGHSGSLGVDFSNLEMVENDWELESKEVYFLGKGLNSPVRPKEVEKVIFDKDKLGRS
ncbi:hypothetical protein Tco_0421553 [Tanacetum coccineum]